MKRFDYALVTGHELICSGLKQAVRSGRTVSAYLFSGAEGIGKKTVSRVFSASLLCHSPKDGVPCLSCPSCRLLAADSHPDLIRLTAPVDKKSIGVETVREQIIREAYIRPFHSERKVFVIENGELMTPEAQNALLKVLEEPPSYAVFLLLATAPDQLLETVRSRCLKLQLLPLSHQACRTFFEAQAPADSRKTLAASFSQGVLGRGIKMLTDAEYYKLYQETVSQLSAFSHGGTALSDMQQFLTANRERIQDVIDFMLVFLRDVLRTGMSQNAPLICTDQKTAIEAFSRTCRWGGPMRMMDAVIRFRERLNKNASFAVAGLELLTSIQEEIHD